MQIKLIDFISIPTRETARALAWYRDVLGLSESGMTEGELEAPNVTLSFWEPERERLPFVANEVGIALRVPDVAAARAELEAKGVKFSAETWDSGVCHFAAFRDLDGNVLILHRRYAPRMRRAREP
jgi:catechol 2,3-dioxygenase-like lactoylglutathione lyase family enzyme